MKIDIDLDFNWQVSNSRFFEITCTPILDCILTIQKVQQWYKNIHEGTKPFIWSINSSFHDDDISFGYSDTVEQAKSDAQASLVSWLKGVCL